MHHCLLLAAAPVALAGCQGKSAEDSPAPDRARVPVIEVRSGSNGSELEARITPGRPCRADIAGTEVIAGVDPLVAMVGEARWTGEEAANGTTLRKNGEQVARLSSTDDQYALFDPTGVPMERAFATADGAKIVNAAGQELRTVARGPSGIVVHMSTGADRRVTGTTDLLLAALLAADETSPEVRALAACHRLAPRDANRESDVPARP